MGVLLLKVLALALGSLGGVYTFAPTDLISEIHKPHVVVGGERAEIKDFKYQVSLRRTGESNHGHVCGASILNSKHVLTAAHCIRGQIPKLYYVVTGSTTLGGGERHFVDKYMIHDKYTSGATGTRNDVAVLRVDKPFVFDGNTNSAPIPLVEENKEPADKTDVVVAGWGKFGDNANEKVSEHLRKAVLKTVNRAECQKCYAKNANHKRIITPDYICAGGNRKDASTGDSGGGLVDTKLKVQIGIASFGDESNVCPGVYTNLARKEIRDFIQKAINSKE